MNIEGGYALVPYKMTSNPYNCKCPLCIHSHECSDDIKESVTRKDGPRRYLTTCPDFSEARPPKVYSVSAGRGHHFWIKENTDSLCRKRIKEIMIRNGYIKMYRYSTHPLSWKILGVFTLADKLIYDCKNTPLIDDIKGLEEINGIPQKYPEHTKVKNLSTETILFANRFLEFIREKFASPENIHRADIDLIYEYFDIDYYKVVEESEKMCERRA